MPLNFFKLIFLTFLFFNTNELNAQKLKDYVLNIEYQAVPPYPLHNNKIAYHYYAKEQFITKNNEIKTIESHSTGNSERTAFYEFNLPHFGIFSIARKELAGSYRLEMNIGLASLENKTIKSINRQNSINTAFAPNNNIVYELTYTMPFTLVMHNAKDSVIFDEKNMFSKPVKFIFPDDFQTIIPNTQNYVTQQDLENIYLKNQGLVNFYAKDKIIANHLNIFSKTLGKRHEEEKGLMNFEFYYLKDKNTEYHAFDSALTIMKTVCDSVKQNLKSKNYKNWHTPYIKQQTQIADKIVMRLAAEYKHKLETATDNKDFYEEIVFALVKNRYAILMLQNRYEEAIAEIEVYLSIGKFSKALSKVYLERMLDNFKDEQRRFLKNKKIYKWN